MTNKGLHHRYNDCLVVCGDTFDPTCEPCGRNECDGDCVEASDAGLGAPRVTCPICREDMGLPSLPDADDSFADILEAREAGAAVFARIFDG